jgi:hypothetical protein
MHSLWRNPGNVSSPGSHPDRPQPGPYAPTGSDSRAPHIAHPNRHTRLLIGLPPGGPTDVVARIVAPKLGDALGQQIVNLQLNSLRSPPWGVRKAATLT